MSIGFIKAYALPARQVTAAAAQAAEPAAASLGRTADGLGRTFRSMLAALDAGASPQQGAKLINGLEGGIAVSAAKYPGLSELQYALKAAQGVGRSLDTSDAVIALPRHGTSADAQLKHLRNALKSLGDLADYRMTPWSHAHRTP